MENENVLKSCPGLRLLKTKMIASVKLLLLLLLLKVLFKKNIQTWQPEAQLRLKYIQSIRKYVRFLKLQKNIKKNKNTQRLKYITYRQTNSFCAKVELV